MSKRRVSSNEGFSLLELTTAFFLLTTCAFGMVQMFHVGVWSARAANERQIALRAIQNELETLRATPNQITVGDKLPFTSHTPELETLHLATPELTVQADPALPLLHIRASIRWIAENGRATSAALEMLLAHTGPTSASPSPTNPTNVIPAKGDFQKPIADLRLTPIPFALTLSKGGFSPKHSPFTLRQAQGERGMRRSGTFWKAPKAGISTSP